MTQNISASQNTVLFARVVKSKQLALQSVYDSKKFILHDTVLFAGDVQSKTLNSLLCSWMGFRFLSCYIFVESLLGGFELYILITIFPANWYTSFNIHYLLSKNMNSNNISICSKLHPVTVAWQELYVIVLALPSLLWTPTSLCSCCWLLLPLQQLEGPLAKSLHHHTLSGSVF